ncbi:MAG: choline/ethanolamine kinase family protein [Arcobacteraceae bacterium]
MNETIQTLKQLQFFKNKQPFTLELLKNQGYCNINYKLKTPQKEYLIRVFQDDTTVNISRNFEFQIQKKASQKNIAPKPFVLDLENFLMITEFINGINRYTLTNLELIKLTKTIKKFHSFNTNQKEYDLKKDFQSYHDILKDKDSKEMSKASFQELKKLKKYKKQLVLSHHDLNAKNIIFTKNSIKIIDWEYAGINDLFFDLASVCCEFNLSTQQQKLLLNTYFKKTAKKDMSKLKSYTIIYKNLCLLWFKSLEKKQ